MAESRLPTN